MVISKYLIPVSFSKHVAHLSVRQIIVYETTYIRCVCAARNIFIFTHFTTFKNMKY